MEADKMLITFVISKSRMNKLGMCPLRCRITYKKERFEFSTGEFVKPQHWQSKLQLSKPPSVHNNQVNVVINQLKNKIQKVYLLLLHTKKDFFVQDIVNEVFPKKIKKEDTSLDMIFYKYIIQLENLVGIDYKLATIWKYKQARNLLVEFLKNHKKVDYDVKNVDINFIIEFEIFLKVKKKLSVATVYKTIQKLKKVISIALQNNIINTNPFIGFKSTRPKIDIKYLELYELELLVNHEFTEKRLENVRKIFVFCCYTGLAYNEVSNLKWEHLVTGEDKNISISMIRGKTNKKLFIPLFTIARDITDFYKKENSEFVFPKLSNQKVNSYLKEIAKTVGIVKNVTHHMARKTFATFVLLYNDVSMEIVSELLGHSNIAITHTYYAKVMDKKISEKILE